MSTLSIEQIFDAIDCGKKKGYITRKEAKNAKTMFGGVFVVEKGWDFEKFKSANQENYIKFAGYGSVLNANECVATDNTFPNQGNYDKYTGYGSMLNANECVATDKTFMSANRKNVKFKLPEEPTWFNFVKNNQAVLTKIMKDSGIQKEYSMPDMIHCVKLAVALNNNNGEYNRGKYRAVLLDDSPEFPSEISEEMLKKAMLIMYDVQETGSCSNDEEVIPNK